MLIFFAMRMLPGDPLIIFIAQSQQVTTMSPEALQQLRHEYGLDRPLVNQYITWLGGIFRGDFGDSIFYHRPVAGLLLERYPVTIGLGFVSFVISSILGIIVGLIAAIRRGKLADLILTPLSYIGITIPSFWLGVLMIYVLGLQLNWLPMVGYTSPFKDPVMCLKQAIMPVICLSVGALSATARQMRSSLLEVIRQDYIRTAWAKGLEERVIVMKHAIKNSLIPVVTVLGLHLGTILGGSVIVENIFSIPGIGNLMVSSIFNHDFAIVQSCTLTFAVMIIFINLLVDISYGWLDPKTRYS
jgi:peptide/nickel transport system permease protein